MGYKNKKGAINIIYVNQKDQLGDVHARQVAKEASLGSSFAMNSFSVSS